MSDFGGINPQHAVAGFGGGLAALPFMQPKNWWYAAGLVLAGLCVASFVTPLVAEIMEGPKVLGSPLSPQAELGLGFLLGLSAMITIPAFLAALGWVKDNISRIMERLTGVAPKPPEGPQ